MEQLPIYVVAVKTRRRVAPTETLSLPQLELMGVLLGAQMSTYLRKAMDFDLFALTLWTDFMIALRWVKGKVTQWNPFVANCVREVREKRKAQRLGGGEHRPGVHNPADLLTRGVSPSSLKSFNRWWNGPTWLS